MRFYMADTIVTYCDFDGTHAATGEMEYNHG